ncbi:MAG: DUF1385 domain-containing protein [Eubacterium sp.]|nr:DUF1385 domain-containing protein [Eubacterium sp.]
MNTKNDCRCNSGIGGQAVLEGIMMRNKDKYAIAVRKPDGEIEVHTEDYVGLVRSPVPGKIPIIRGVIAFIESLVVGIRCLMYSASFFEEEEDQKETNKDSTADRTAGQDAEDGKPAADRKESGQDIKTASGPADKDEKKSDTLFVAGTLIVSFAMAVGLFMVIPYVVSRLLGSLTDNQLILSIAEALIRVGIFLGYLVVISNLKDIQRTFAYHGAEHKCINCIESGKELTVENVLSSSRLHRRCGTSFLFFVIIVSIIFQMFISVDSRVAQILIRIALIPVIAGVSYEIIRLAGISNHPVMTALSKPGMALQKLTTKEPDKEQAEVAIQAVEAVFDWKTFLSENKTKDVV